VVLDGWRESYRPEYWRNFYQRPISLATRTVSQRSRGIQRLTLQFVRLANPIEDYQYIFSTEGFPSLERLTLHPTDIDDKVLSAVSGRSPGLKVLTLKKCKRISGEGLKVFARGQAIEFSLNVEGCQHIDKDDIDVLSTMVNLLVL